MAQPSICIFGAGAIGGYLAATLEAAGTNVAIVVRGAHRDAILAEGLRLQSEGKEIRTHPRVATDPAELGPQDYLILTLKAHSLEPALPQLRALIGPGTTIVAAVNGIPWWYTYALEGPFTNRRIAAVDPNGALWEGLPPAQTLGCVVYPAAEIAAPGVVRHTYGDRFSLGEPDGSRSARALKLSQILIAAGLKAPVRPRIRDE
ncbi:MAG: 2-dehydropantoate 2-reductase, partial [Acetobacteraceae bacterium]|nr:2-dehydropantoate 2-reductase [Acetobacteraceae bacterium]